MEVLGNNGPSKVYSVRPGLRTKALKNQAQNDWGNSELIPDHLNWNHKEQWAGLPFVLIIIVVLFS